MVYKGEARGVLLLLKFLIINGATDFRVGLIDCNVTKSISFYRKQNS